MELFIGVVIGLFVLVFLVVIHELGHAIVAKRNGVVVEEFGIGFPPRAWSKKLKNGVLFTLNWLPLGGFVKMQGEYDSSRGKGDYGAASFWQKTKILLAGVLINWLMAVVLLTVLALTGLPRVIPNQFSLHSDTSTTRQPVEIAQVTKDSPADTAGLETGDRIIRFEGKSVPTPESLVQQTERHKGDSVDIIYERDGVERTTSVTLNSDNTQGQGYLGVGPAQREEIKATWSAPIVGVVTTGQLTWVTLQGLGDLLANLATGIVLQLSPDQSTRQQADQNLSKAGSSVAGPIGILGVIFPAAEQAGLTQLVFLTALISLTLAVMNTLPIPGLDGGRWFTMAVFRLLRKPLTKQREENIQATGFLILMTLVVVVTIADVGKVL